MPNNPNPTTTTNHAQQVIEILLDYICDLGKREIETKSTVMIANKSRELFVQPTKVLQKMFLEPRTDIGKPCVGKSRF